MYTSSGKMLSFNSVRFWMPIFLLSTLLACRLIAKPVTRFADENEARSVEIQLAKRAMCELNPRNCPSYFPKRKKFERIVIKTRSDEPPKTVTSHSRHPPTRVHLTSSRRTSILPRLYSIYWSLLPEGVTY